NPIQATYGGGLSEGFLTKLNAAGNALVYSTYLGGDTFDEARDVAVDSTGSAYVAGRSTSSNFATVNPIQATFKGGGSDITISKLTPAGDAFVYSTYLGGGGGLGFEAPFGIAVDATGNAYITGQTSSTDFPTASPIQATFGGGSPTGDAFVTKINAAGNALVYSTYLGGTNNEAGFGIVVDSAGNAYVAGQTFSSTTFPIANALQGTFGGGGSDGFLTKLNAAGNAYVYSTYFGGSGDESFNEIALDSASNVYAAGATNSTNYPTANPTQAAFGGGTGDAVLTKINAAGSVLLFSTYLGGGDFDRGNALAVDSSGNAYVAGLTASTNFTTLNPVQAANAGGNDAFVTKLDPSIVAAPVANNDAYSTAEDTVLTVAAPGVLGNDVSAIALTAILVTQPAHGTLAFNSNGSFTYTPAANYNGSDSFTYKANNGTSDSNTATVSITISAVNDAPVNTVPGAQTIDGSTPLTFSVLNSNAITVSDIDAGPASVRVTLTATNGTLSLSTTFGLVFITGDGTGDATMTFTGALSSINGALNSMTYTPTAGFSGAASVQITTDDLGNTGAGGALSDTDSISITVNQRSLQFSAADYTVGEAQGQATIIVTRTGDTTAPATVDYQTSDLSGLNNCDVNTGNASARCDYTAVGGTLTFAAGVASRTFTVPIINDVYVEGPEHLTLTLSNPTGGILAIPSTVLLNITDDDTTAGAPNPINTRTFFIRQLYLDVLNREPEPSGLAAWLNRLNTCPQPGETIQNCDEIEVASAFFRSPEFFDRVYFIYKVYEEALGRQPQYDEYQRDIRRVTGFLTSQELEARKQQFVLEFTQRQEFKNRYDHITDSGAFVDALLQTAGVQLDSTTRALLISQLANSHIQRWDVLRIVANSPEVSQKFFNKAFVVVGYFAFLRRNPDINYLHWIDVLNTTREYREMIRGFIQSSEYRLRFGPI
ncbi:MAG TPA: SBBP repeat-containing protein, partial [Pyrinomonadaceae bacterium]